MEGYIGSSKGLHDFMEDLHLGTVSLEEVGKSRKKQKKTNS